ncbi:MAG TPA: hypothetical protein VG370_15470, partial [Chloroflexota bacterium]|nr:hypothetical protein [Chloroflexota bacterium]
SGAAPAAPIASTPYRSAAGRFQIELPEGFTTREAPGMAEFAAPDGRMRVVVTWTDLGGPPTDQQLIADGRSLLTARYGAALIENFVGPYNDGVFFGFGFRDRSGFTGTLSLSGRGRVAYGLLLDGRTSQPELFRRLQYTFSPPSAVEPGAVLVQQDFSGGGGGLGEASNAFVEAGVVEGAYRFLFRQGGRTRDTGVSGQFGPDVTIELDVTKARGPDDATAIVYCRTRDSANSYELWFQPDGAYGIGKRRNGELERLTRGAAPAAIRSGGATNRVRADCVGDTLTLTVNGQRLAEVKDADYKLGGVRFGARSPEGGAGTTILVDNLIVRRA